MAQTQYKFTEADFLNQVGRSIDSYTNLDEQEVKTFINEVSDQVYMLINQYAGVSAYIEDDCLSEWQIEQLKKAMISQAEYLLVNNINTMLAYGIDRYTNATISTQELQARYWSPKAKVILTNAGFLYRGLR
jgi:hypothetical protein